MDPNERNSVLNTILRLFRTGLIGLIASTSIILPAFAQEEVNVTSIDIVGNETVSEQTVLSQIRTSVGRPLSTQLLSEDLKRLYGLGYFKDVQIAQNRNADGVDIVFTVKEKSILQDIVIQGNAKINEKKIKENIRSKTGDFIDEQIIRRDVDAIRNLYASQGFTQATVDYQLDYMADTNQASLHVDINEGTKVVVREIKFDGNFSVKEGEIRKKISTKSRAWFGLVNGILKEDELDLDIQRVRAVYDEHGFSDAKVTYRLDEAKEDGSVLLVFEIDEGRQYLIGDISTQGNILFTNEEIFKALGIKTDDAFSRRGLRQSVSNIQDIYFEKGYMNARVFFDSLYNDQTGRVDIVYNITENNITTVNRVIIRGNVKTQDIVIRRELRVYPGEPFNGAMLKRSKERLFNLGYFEEVQFDTEDTEDPDSKNLVVTVTEAKTGEFSFGGGFSSIDKAVGFVQIRQRNFDMGKWPTFTGAGQDLAFRVQLGAVRSNGELSWTDPWFLGYPFSFGFDAYRREFDRTRSSGLFFDEERTGGRLRLGKELTDFDRLALHYSYENVEISDIPTDASADVLAEEGENNISRSTLIYTRDTRDNQFVPTKGYLFQTSGEFAGGFLGGDRDFWKGASSLSAYFSIVQDHVIELQGRAAIADEHGDSLKVPIFERYYLGGANTVRGYRERRIGPRDPNTQDPIGGESLWVGNAEYTFPIVPEIIKGAIFYDIGGLEAELEDFASGDIYQGIGIGARINTPIGPIKVDAGYPLDDVPGEDKEVRFYFNMSRGF